MEFRVLGDLEVQHDLRAIPLGAHQQRALLAILVVNAGEVVTADRLIDGIWGDEPPARAAKTVQVYVSRLRKALAAVAGSAADDLIVTREHGYALHVDPEQVDAAVFEGFWPRAGVGSPMAPSARRERLNEALALWRGAALPTSPSTHGRRRRSRASRSCDWRRSRPASTPISSSAATRRWWRRAGGADRPPPDARTSARTAHARALPRGQTVRSARGVSGDAPDSRRRARRRARPSATGAPRGDRCARTLRSTCPPRPRRRPRGMTTIAASRGGRPWPVSARRRRRRGARVDSARRRCSRDHRRAQLGRRHRPRSQRGDSAITVGARPSDISAGAGAVWVANLDDNSVSKIDPRAERLAKTWSTGKSVDGLTTAGGAVWTLDGPDATVLRIDPNFGQVVKSTRLGKPPGGTSTERPSPIGAAPNAVWASTGNAAVARLATSTGDVTGKAPSATSLPASPTARERPGSRTTSMTTSGASIAPGS